MAKKSDETPIKRREAREFLGVSNATMTRYMKEQGLPYLKSGKLTYFYKSELNEWLEKFRKKSV